MNRNSFEYTPSRWLTRRDAAHYAGISVDKLDDLANAGVITKVKYNPAKNGRVLFDKVSIDAYIKSLIVPIRRAGT